MSVTGASWQLQSRRCTSTGPGSPVSLGESVHDSGLCARGFHAGEALRAIANGSVIWINSPIPGRRGAQASLLQPAQRGWFAVLCCMSAPVQSPLFQWLVTFPRNSLGGGISPSFFLRKFFLIKYLEKCPAISELLQQEKVVHQLRNFPDADFFFLAFGSLKGLDFKHAALAQAVHTSQGGTGLCCDGFSVIRCD